MCGSNPVCHRNGRAGHGSRRRYKHECVRMPLWYSVYLAFRASSVLCIVAQLPRGSALRLCVRCSVSRAQSHSCPVNRCARRLRHRVSATGRLLPRVDYHVISSALNLRDGARAYVVDVGHLFCVATLERVLGGQLSQSLCRAQLGLVLSG